MDMFVDWARESYTAYGPMLLTGVATLIVGWLAAGVLTAVLRRILKRAGVDVTLAGFCANLVYMALLALVAVTALDRFGFPKISFAAILGAAGLAIGLALKGSLSNLAAGVMLIVFRPFNIGDRIEAAGVSGVVSCIQVFATTLETEDDRRIIISNAALTAGNITNCSTG